MPCRLPVVYAASRGGAKRYIAGTKIAVRESCKLSRYGTRKQSATTNPNSTVDKSTSILTVIESKISQTTPCFARLAQSIDVLLCLFPPHSPSFSLYLDICLILDRVQLSTEVQGPMGCTYEEHAVLTHTS